MTPFSVVILLLFSTITNSARLKPLQSKLIQTIRPENCRREHRIFTEKPHMAGSVRNYELAQYIAKQWREYGLEDVELVEHPVYLPWPVRYEATLVAANEKLSLKEDPIPQDKDSYSDEVGIPYCAYSADVDVTAPVVYVNSGSAALSAARTAVERGERARVERIHKGLMKVERALLDEAGLAGRPWFKHLIYAPRPTYKALVLPALTEAIEAGNTNLAQSEVVRLTRALNRAAKAIQY